MGYMGTSMTEEEIRKLGQGAAQFKAELPKTAAPTGSVPMVGPVLPGAARPNVPVSANTATPQNTTLQGPYANPNGGYQAGLNVVGGVPQYNQPQAAQPTAQPMSAGQAMQPPKDYAALAAARTALALQQKQTIANQQKASAQTAFDQQSLRTKDDRVLGDFSRTQTANPFGNMGRKSFQESLIGRERTQADADASAALTTQKANIDQMLADYQNATADEQIRIADELKRADQAYQLDLAKFNQGQSNWEKEFGQSQQQIDYSQNPNNPANQGQVLQNQGQAQQNLLNQYKIDDYPAEQKANATKIQQDLQTGKMNLEAAEYNLKQLKDPNSAANQSAKLELQIKALEAKNLPEKLRLELQGLKKSNDQIGVVHYKPQTAAEIEQDQLQIRKLTAEVNKLENPSSENVTVEDYAKKYLDGLAKYDSEGVVTNGAALESQILSSGKTEAEMRQMYARFNLKWG